MTSATSPGGGAGSGGEQAQERVDQTAGQASEKAEQVADTAHTATDEAASKAHNLIEQAQHKAQEAVGQAREKTQDLLSRAQSGESSERVQQVQSQVQEVAGSEWNALAEDYRSGRYDEVARRVMSWVGALVLLRGALRFVTGRGRAQRARARLGEDLMNLLEASPRSPIAREAKVAARDDKDD